MKHTRGALILTVVYLCSACAVPGGSAVPPEPAVSPAATARPGVPATPLSPGEQMLSMLPACAGVAVLAEAVAFSWPNVEKRIKDLEGSSWGYFGCGQAQAEVSAFYREQMPRPPYNMRETNWVDRREGTLGIYYHTGYQLWVYMWVVPAGAQAAHVIVAVANAEAFEPMCRAPAAPARGARHGPRRPLSN